MAPMVDGEETMGGLEAEPGRAPVSTALWTEIGPTKVLGAGKGPGCSRRGPRRRKSTKSSVARGEGLDGSVARTA